MPEFKEGTTNPPEAGAAIVKQFWHKAMSVAEVPSYDEMRVALLNVDGGSPLVLLGSAVVIWDLLDGTRTEADMLQELLAVFSGTDERAMEGHLRNFLADLSHQGLAESRSTPARLPRGTETSNE